MSLLYLLVSSFPLVGSAHQSYLLNQCFIARRHYIFAEKHYIITTVTKYKSLKIIDINVLDISIYINQQSKIKHVSHIPKYLMLI